MFNTRNTVLTIAALAIAAVLVLAPSAARAEMPIDVFLLAGQSNMAGRAATSGLPTSPVNLQQPQDDVLFYYGSSLTTLRPGSGADFGPEITFGRTTADYFPAKDIALIKYAVGGTNLYSDWASGGSQYNTWINTVSAGITALTNQGYAPQIVGMLWTQGERDAKADRTTAQYENDLNVFIADMRSRYGSDMPFFLSRLSSNQSSIPPNQLTEIRTAQENVAANDPLSYMIDTDTFSVKGDFLHFDAAGQIDLGEAFADSYYATTPEPATLALLAIGGLAVIRRKRRA